MMIQVIAVALLAFASCVQAGSFSAVTAQYNTTRFLLAVPTPAAEGGYSYIFAPANASSKPSAGIAVEVDRNDAVQGWDYIRFRANQTFLANNLTEAYYAAGYAEGYLTADAMYSSFVTGMSQNGGYLPDSLNTTEGNLWLAKHIDFMRSVATTNDTAYGRVLRGILRQIDGLTDGYAAALRDTTAWKMNAASAPAPLSWTEVFYISFQVEISRAAAGAAALFGSADSASAARRSFAHVGERFDEAHCSALVRVTSDDVYLGHDTWSSYNCMVRQMKTYELYSSVTLSGYPGSLSSIDDWYTTSLGLAVTETSLGIMTDEYDEFVVPESVSEFARVMIANYISSSAPQWAAVFTQYNSGTYNNQYMVLDTNLAALMLPPAGTQGGPKIVLYPDTFWVLEQSPGLIVAEDMTSFLNEHGFWPSYNIPYFEAIFVRAGFAAAAASPAYGMMSNYSTYFRARLFERLAPQVHDLASMYSVMRHNKWQTDPESLIPWCITGKFQCAQNRSAMLAIASRGDLAPQNNNEAPDSSSGQGAVGAVVQAAFGAIDTKITSVRMMTAVPGQRSGIAINGPTAVSQPAFNLTAFGLQYPEQVAGYLWRGVPTFFGFSPISFTEGTRRY